MAKAKQEEPPIRVRVKELSIPTWLEFKAGTPQEIIDERVAKFVKSHNSGIHHFSEDEKAHLRSTPRYDRNIPEEYHIPHLGCGGRSIY